MTSFQISFLKKLSQIFQNIFQKSFAFTLFCKYFFQFSSLIQYNYNYKKGKFIFINLQTQFIKLKFPKQYFIFIAPHYLSSPFFRFIIGVRNELTNNSSSAKNQKQNRSSDSLWHNNQYLKNSSSFFGTDIQGIPDNMMNIHIHLISYICICIILTQPTPTVMGNTESQSMNLPPMIKKIKDSLNLEQEASKRQTGSLIHHTFSQQFSQPDSNKLRRTMSPFCPLDIEDHANWITGCFVSPVMLFSSPLYLCDNNGVLAKKVQALPVYKESISPVAVEEVIMVQQYDMCLVVLQKPFWKVGWAGISFVADLETLKTETLKIVNHPTKTLNQQTDTMVHIQMGKKFIMPKQKYQKGVYTLDHKGHLGSLICKLVDKKPYIIGVQASENQVVFISEANYNFMMAAAKKYMRKYNREREILKDMDIVQFEKEIMW